MTSFTDNIIRDRIFQKIRTIPSDKLMELEAYVLKLENSINKKGKILSFAGAWEDMEDDVFNDFTESLMRRRQENKRRADD